MSWEDAVRWIMSEPAMSALAKASYFEEPHIAARRYWQSAEFLEIKRLLGSRRGRALDLGSGNGILAWALAKEGWSVTAVEPDPSSLVGAGAIRTLASQPGIDISVVEAYGENLPLKSGSFDLIVARQVLHHASDLPAFCREMKRLGRPGTIILTLRDHVISGPEQLQPFLMSHPLHSRYGGENAFQLDQYRSALEDAGISIQRQYLSLQSVLNYDPSSPDEISARISMKAGVLSPIAEVLLKLIPRGLVFGILGALDKRPGRLVSFVGAIN